MFPESQTQRHFVCNLQKLSFKCLLPTCYNPYLALKRILSNTFLKVSCLMFQISSLMLSLRCCSVHGFFTYTLYFRDTHKKKSAAERLGVLGGQFISPLLERTPCSGRALAVSVDR
jgi:hypothetical protein